MNKLVEEIEKDITGVILDLRNNPGGLLNQGCCSFRCFS